MWVLIAPSEAAIFRGKDMAELQYCAKRLARKNVSEMTYFVSSETLNINLINQSTCPGMPDDNLP